VITSRFLDFIRDNPAWVAFPAALAQQLELTSYIST
jgi:hypothetical protein